MIKLARILKIDEKTVELQLEKNSSCGDCNNKGCSDGFLNFIFPKNTILSVSKKQEMLSQTHLDDKDAFFSQKYQKGDVIGMKFNESQLFKLALALYGLPILLIIVSLMFFYYLFSLINFNNDLGGVIGLILGLVISKNVIKLNRDKFKPQVEFFK